MGSCLSKDAASPATKDNKKNGATADNSDPQSAKNAFGANNNPLSALNPAVVLDNLLTQTAGLTSQLGKRGDTVMREGAHHLKVIFAQPFDAELSTFVPPSNH